jgi:hypothetical protein
VSPVGDDRLVLAIDPGIRGAGVALFRAGVLVRAAYVRNLVEEGCQVAACVAMARAVWEWVAGALGLPEGRPEPAVWRWLARTFPNASEWLRAVLGADAEATRLPDVVVCEWPQIYYGPKQSGDQNDLPPLAGVDAALGALFPGAELVSVAPREWKGGSVDKQVMCDRVWARLSPEEQARVERRPRGGLDHNTVDAAGVGLWFLGRLRRRRAYA